MRHIKTLLCLIIFSFAMSASAQTILKINGTLVTISGDFSGLKKGQPVNFLDSSLEVKAKGAIENISPQGKVVTVRVASGTPSKDDTFEIVGETKEITKNKSAPLTPEDQKILDRGEIGTGAYVVGGILGTYPLGFGIGHAIQGRYLDKGWIFTVGELGSLGLIVAGAVNCSYSLSNVGGCANNGETTLGVLGFVGFKIWEIIDLWAGPPEHNRRYRALKERVGQTSWSPFIAPTKNSFLLGLQYKF